MWQLALVRAMTLRKRCAFALLRGVAILFTFLLVVGGGIAPLRLVIVRMLRLGLLRVTSLVCGFGSTSGVALVCVLPRSDQQVRLGCTSFAFAGPVLAMVRTLLGECVRGVLACSPGGQRPGVLPVSWHEKRSFPCGLLLCEGTAMRPS